MGDSRFNRGLAAIGTLLTRSQETVVAYAPTVKKAASHAIGTTIDAVQTYGPDVVAIVGEGVQQGMQAVARGQEQFTHTVATAARDAMSLDTGDSPEALKEAIDKSWLDNIVRILQQEPFRLLENVPGVKDSSPLFIEYIMHPTRSRQFGAVIHSQAILHCFMTSIEKKNFINIALIIKHYPNVLTKFYATECPLNGNERSFFIHTLRATQDNPDCFRVVLNGFKILLDSQQTSAKRKAPLEDMKTILINHATNLSPECIEIFKEVLPDLHAKALPKLPPRIVVTTAPAAVSLPPPKEEQRPVIKIDRSHPSHPSHLAFNPFTLSTLESSYSITIEDNSDVEDSDEEDAKEKEVSRNFTALITPEPEEEVITLPPAPPAVAAPPPKPKGRTRHFTGEAPPNSSSHATLNAALSSPSPANNQNPDITPLKVLQNILKTIMDMPLPVQLGFITAFVAFLVPITLVVSAASPTAGFILGGTGGVLAAARLFSVCKNYKNPSTPPSTPVAGATPVSR